MVTIHMVSSLDGYIAKKDGDTSWMNSKDYFDNGIELTKEYVNDFLKSVDCYVMGSKTYEQALELGWPYGDTKVFVLTSQSLKRNRDTVQFYSGNLETLVQQKLKTSFKNIWMVGGASLTSDFINKALADEIVLSITPIILGDGIPFFNNIVVEKQLKLKGVQAFKDGVVELTYRIKGK